MGTLLQHPFFSILGCLLLLLLLPTPTDAATSLQHIQTTTSAFLPPLRRLATAATTTTTTTRAAITTMSGNPTNPSRPRLVTNKKCPFAQKAWIALEEYYGGAKGYELLEVGLYGGNGKPKWFMDINPAGQVPVMWLPNGRIITESDLILDHLASLPDRSKSSDSNPLIPPSPEAFKKWRSLLGSFLKSARTKIERGDTAGLSSLLFKLDKQIPPPSPYLAGATFSVCDCAALPFFQRLVDDHADLVEQSAPKIFAWYQEASQQPSFKATRISGYWWWW